MAACSTCGAGGAARRGDSGRVVAPMCRKLRREAIPPVGGALHQPPLHPRRLVRCAFPSEPPRRRVALIEFGKLGTLTVAVRSCMMWLCRRPSHHSREHTAVPKSFGLHRTELLPAPCSVLTP